MHWPFCEAKCPYCDFNSHVVASVDHLRWARALVADLTRQAQDSPDRILGSIFFGGGTPSRMQPETVAAVIDAARALWPSANDLEITLEANPTSVEADRFRGFADAGVNRVSMGFQALRDDDLRRLGRTHDVAQALAAWEVARTHFPRASFDVIYARQHQGFDAWKTELAEIAALGPEHLSLYQLTIEPGTVFGRRAEAGRLDGLPDGERSADMYLFTNDFLASQGYAQYETSNHARAAGRCCHNLTYWRAGDWLGIGPGAHGRFGLGAARRATVAHRMPQRWLDAVETDGQGTEICTTGDATGHAEEYLLTATRLAEGIDLSRLSRLGLMLDPPTDLIADGLLRHDAGRLIPTAHGLALADRLAVELVQRSNPVPVSRSQSESS